MCVLDFLDRREHVLFDLSLEYFILYNDLQLLVLSTKYTTPFFTNRKLHCEY